MMQRVLSPSLTGYVRSLWPSADRVVRRWVHGGASTPTALRSLAGPPPPAGAAAPRGDAGPARAPGVAPGPPPPPGAPRVPGPALRAAAIPPPPRTPTT